MKKIVLAVLVILGVFVWIGTSKSMTSYKIQCALGDEIACYNTGIMYETGKDVGGNIINKNIEKAIEYYTVACEKNNINACYNLGSIYWKGEDGIVRNPSKSIVLMDKACSLGDKQACSSSEMFSMAHNYSKDKKPKSIDEMTEKDKKELRNVIGNLLDKIDNK
jgi:TPR repeat protein